MPGTLNSEICRYTVHIYIYIEGPGLVSHSMAPALLQTQNFGIFGWLSMILLTGNATRCFFVFIHGSVPSVLDFWLGGSGCGPSTTSLRSHHEYWYLNACFGFSSWRRQLEPQNKDEKHGVPASTDAAALINKCRIHATYGNVTVLKPPHNTVRPAYVMCAFTYIKTLNCDHVGAQARIN